MSSITSPGIQRVPTDSGTAIPVGGALSLVGAGGITTSASGSTVTITGGGGGGITTIDGNVNSATGSTVSLLGSLINSGASVRFEGDNVSSVHLDLSDVDFNTLLGSNSGGSTIAGAQQNTAVGRDSLTSLTSGTNNCVLGYSAASSLQDGSSCIAIGSQSMEACVSNSSCIAIGSVSMLGATGSNNIVIGNGSLSSGSSTGDKNIAIGSQAMGTGATSAHDNVAIGYQAAESLTTGFNSVVIGSEALKSNNAGNYNVVIGKGAMSLGAGGSNNVVVGSLSYLVDTGGNQNTIIGDECFQNVSSGATLNVIIGANAGNSLTTNESNNILIGSLGVVGDNNTTRIGYINSATPTQTKCYIDGISGNSVSNTAMVTIDSTTGQLGSQSIPAGAISWTVITADQSAISGNGYFCNKAGTVCAIALPATSSVGDIFSVVAMNTQGWNVTQASGQQIFFGAGSTTLGATGFLAFGGIGNTATLVCRVANTEWQVISNVGNITPN